MKLQILEAKKDYECHRCHNPIKIKEVYIMSGSRRLCNNCGFLMIKSLLGV